MKNCDPAEFGLIARAMERRYATSELEPLDDAMELAANKAMFDRLMADEGKEL